MNNWMRIAKDHLENIFIVVADNPEPRLSCRGADRP